MHEKRCEVCGESVPRDAMRVKGRLRCCLRCAQPPVVDDELLSGDPAGYPPGERLIRRHAVFVGQADRLFAAEAGTLRMRVATFTSR